MFALGGVLDLNMHTDHCFPGTKDYHLITTHPHCLSPYKKLTDGWRRTYTYNFIHTYCWREESCIWNLFHLSAPKYIVTKHIQITRHAGCPKKTRRGQWDKTVGKTKYIVPKQLTRKNSYKNSDCQVFFYFT